ncbi:hypothetical protein EG352_19875 [Chryseobacterium indologenes]|uniref:Lipoprotein n=2 Tax=Chryseobacterium indologenes TaxID=253 RepID=A0AAD1DXV4_CHRID|nr:hypothetical protein [Chryseobacterium indologenes]ASE64069.1 hypothetical protein CEQ15_22685 [Chryseobacterium indologenes]AZB19857.1 hypothetical protein EG352_19875 [Chryseobacterium indologenes]
MVNNLKNITSLASISLLMFSCKNPEQKSLNILELSDLQNYKIKEIKLNDTVVKIYGKNSEYTIEGLMDRRNHSRQKWWNIKSRINKNWFEIEYIFLDKQLENQVKLYNNGILDKRASKFYNKSINKGNRQFDFYFPVSEYIINNVELDYVISDTIARKKLREGTVKCEKINDHYRCNIFLKKGENSVMGVVTAFSEFKERDSISLAADRMFIKF